MPIKWCVKNSVDPDKTPRAAASDQELLCLPLNSTTSAVLENTRVTFTTLSAYSADDKLIIFFLFFFSENRLWYYMQIVFSGHVKTYFSGNKIRKNI